MYFALIYDLVEDYLDRRAAFRDEHLGLARAAHDRGQLFMAGAFTEPADRALLVWKTDDPTAAENFARADPYVTNGLVTNWVVRPWSVVIGAEAAGAFGAAGEDGAGGGVEGGEAGGVDRSGAFEVAAQRVGREPLVSADVDGGGVGGGGEQGEHRVR